MPATITPVSDMLVTVKSREVQRAQFAEGAGDREAARRHLLAAAHLELVLAHDYDAAGDPELALRSRISAASCLWSAGDSERGRQALERLQAQYPAQTTAIAEVMAELTRDYPAGGN
jgi:hypothetical protein